MSGNNNGQGKANNGNHHGHDKPSDLGQKVDWMTYSHEALYKMIHEGVDLKAAGSAQADWTAVGKQLADVHELLARAIAQSQQAWSGESADRAREALESVEKWALNTSDHAENVAKCIGDEIQHVQTAREMMPAPVPPPPLPDPAVTPDTGTATPVAPAPIRSPLVSARRPLVDSVYEDRLPVDSLRDPAEPVVTPTTPTSPFTGIDRVGAPAVDSVLTADASHRQAAEVMAMFQQNSYLVDRTVPSFAPPPNPVAPPPPPPVVPPTGPSAPPVDTSGGGHVVAGQPQQQQPGREHTTPQQGRGGGGRGGYAPGRMPMPVMGGASGGGGGGGPLGSPAATPGFVGDRTGGAHPGSVTSQFSSSKAVTPQSGMIGAAPMAAPPPVAGNSAGNSERNRPGYLEEEDNVFGVDRKAAPPVIGL
ncbi:PPE domain-containing protein [Saccharothrix sp.]|uniref:PPE domain-containing protein n=1 Tax=Saccharothrix sp. TaxID=1873460 RepID=UPI0028113D6A|nr:PPE domain-containing protein [Saccharothrix sp.]